MNNLRNVKLFEFDESKEIIFQALEWLGTNQSKQELNTDRSSKKKFISVYKHVIKLYGVTECGKSVTVNNNNFKPYFFIKVPDKLDNLKKIQIETVLKSHLDYKDKDSLVSLEFVKRKDFYGFNNNKLFKFIKITFLNSVVMNKCNKIIKEGIKVTSIDPKNEIKFKLYESNITPFIRFIHTKELNAAGWIRIPPYSYTINKGEDKTSTCQIDIDIDFDDIEFYDKNGISPMLIASYDIECSSSHGDFPLAKKNYKKLGCEIYDEYKKIRVR